MPNHTVLGAHDAITNATADATIDQQFPTLSDTETASHRLLESAQSLDDGVDEPSA